MSRDCKVRGGQTVLFKVCPFSRSTEILGFLGTCVRDKLEHGASSQGSVAELGSRRCLGNGGQTTKHWIVDSRRSKRERRGHAREACVFIMIIMTTLHRVHTTWPSPAQTAADRCICPPSNFGQLDIKSWARVSVSRPGIVGATAT